MRFLPQMLPFITEGRNVHKGNADVKESVVERIMMSMEHLSAAWNSFLTSFLAFLPHLLQALLILVLGYFATRIIPRPIGAMLKRTSIDAVAVKYIQRVVKITLWVLIAVMALDKIGVPVTSLLTVLAAVGAAVALAIRDNLANLASGVVLLFSKPFKAGDFIEIGDLAGTVTEIELMQTYLDTVGNMRIAVPNTKMMTETIVNYSTHDVRRQDLVFSISYENDLLKAKTLLQELADTHPLVLKEPAPPRVVVSEYAASSINLTAQLWCSTSEYWNLRFDLNEKVKALFDQNGIVIPYNQLDVHLCPTGKDPDETSTEGSDGDSR